MYEIRGVRSYRSRGELHFFSDQILRRGRVEMGDGPRVQIPVDKKISTPNLGVRSWPSDSYERFLSLSDILYCHMIRLVLKLMSSHVTETVARCIHCGVSGDQIPK